MAPDGATTTAAPTTTAPLPTTPTAEPPPTRPPHTLIVLGPSGLGVADFGDEPDAAVAAVTSSLGPPSNDSGWTPNPIIDDAEYRTVHWGEDLSLSFGDDETPYGAARIRHFQSYDYSGSPPGLTTVEGIGVGDSVGLLLGAYGTGLVLVQDTIDDSYRYQVHPGLTSDFLCFRVGIEAPNPGTTIDGITAGYACTYGGE